MDSSLVLYPYRFRLDGYRQRAYVRLIPGDGNCLFTAIGAALWYNEYGSHPDLKDPAFNDYAATLRILSANTLAGPPTRIFALENDATISCGELLQVAAAQYNVTQHDYLSWIYHKESWGGGPEIIALCNALEKPIYLYEIDYLLPLDPSEQSSLRRQEQGGEEEEEEEEEEELNKSTTRRCRRCKREGVMSRGINYVKSKMRRTVIGTEQTLDSVCEIILKKSGSFGNLHFLSKDPIHILFVPSYFPNLSLHEPLPSANHFNAMFFAL